MLILLAALGCADPADADADGWLAPEDCDDHDPTVSPSAADDDCDSVDDDCDGLVDESAPEARLWYPDADGDGHGVYDETHVTGCEAPAGYAETPDDCDDTNASALPGGTETAECDGIDEDCDGLQDEEADGATWWYADADADGRGDPDAPVLACSVPEGFVADSTDCDDAVADATEGCAATARLEDAWASLATDDGGYTYPAGLAWDDAGGLLVATASARVYVFPTIPAGETTVAAAPLILDGPTDVRLGLGLAWIPDATGDGHSEVAVSTSDTYTAEGVVYLVDGGGAGTVDFASAYATITGVEDGLAWAPVVPVGEGVWVSAPEADDEAGEARFYAVPSGALGPEDATARLTDPGALGGLSVNRADDLDGDGTPDLLVSADGGTRFVFYDASALGGADFTTADADVWLQAAPDAGLDDGPGSVGDFDGDGKPDLALGAPRNADFAGAVFVWSAPLPTSSAVDEAPTQLLGAERGYAGAALSRVPGAGGADALVVSAPWAEGDRLAFSGGEVWRVDAVAPGVDTLVHAAALRFRGEEYDYLGSSALGAPDVDGDGVSEILLTALRFDGSAPGMVYALSLEP